MSRHQKFSNWRYVPQIIIEHCSVHITHLEHELYITLSKPYLQKHDYNLGRDPSTDIRARTKDIYVLWEHKTRATEDAYIKMWLYSSKQVS
jgi:hypothetical protein